MSGLLFNSIIYIYIFVYICIFVYLYICFAFNLNVLTQAAVTLLKRLEILIFFISHLFLVFVLHIL